jgi:ABC-type sugar transport system permease subunit
MSRTGVRRFWTRHGIGVLFLAPSLLLMAVFTAYPVLSSIYLSFTEWNGIAPVKEWVGLANYERMLEDDLLWLSLRHNAVWIVVGSAGAIGLALLLAVLLSSQPQGFLLFRTAYFLPVIIGPAIVGLLWLRIYEPDVGVLAQLGEALGIGLFEQAFLGEPGTALPAVLVAAIWGGMGLYFLILLAALQGIERDLIDAARLDGASAWQRVRHIVIPQIANAINVTVVLAIIGSLRVFDVIWVMTQGGPANANEVIATYAYKKAFTESDFGYGSALTVVMTVLALVLSALYIRVRERREAA